MRKPKKRALGVLVGLSALALTLTGCTQPGVDDGGSNPDSSGSASGGVIDEAHSVGAMADYALGTTFKATEPIDISLLYRDMPTYPVKEDWMVFKQLEANQNITFTRTDIPFADFATKRGLTITGGDAPELMPVFYTGEETAYVGSGVLLPISDYVSYMPNFQKNLKEWGLSDYLDTKRQSDGKYYQLPGLMEIAKIQYSIIVRDDAWKAAGLTEDPATMADLTTALEKLKGTGLCTGGYALSAGNNARDILQAFSPNFNTAVGEWATPTGAYWDGTQNKYVFSGTQDGHKEIIQYMADLVANGLMDPESMTQSTTNNDAASAKFTSGQSCAVSGNDQDANRLQATLKANGVDTTVHMLRIPSGTFGDYIGGGQRFSSGMIFSAKLAQDPHFKAILQFVDWLYFSPEGVEFAQWGVECTGGSTDSSTCTYTKDSSGKRTLVPDVKNNQGLGAADAVKNLTTDYGFSNGVFWPANGTFEDLMRSYFSPIMIDFSDKMADKKETATPPATPMDDETLQSVAALYTSLKDLVMTNDTKFILGQQPMSDWDAFASSLQAANADQYIQYYNGAVKK